jgi:hypothetical protein
MFVLSETPLPLIHPVLTCVVCSRDGPRPRPRRARQARRARFSLARSWTRLPSWPCSIHLPLPLPRSVPSMNSISATSAPFRGFELRAGVKLRVDEPPFVQGAIICYAKSACCNSIYQMFQMFRGTLQVLYIDVAKVDQDVAHVVIDIHVCLKCMFHLFQTNIASVLSRCCKSKSRYCIYMHVASICFKCFQVFHTYACKCFIWTLHMFAMIFKCFSGVFASVLDTYFKYFICFLLYVTIVASGYSKSRSCVAHGMSVGSGRRRG